uniref:AAA domain-containing protein n=1 Tax=Caenorhabditis japonica TaxID=281687 RepID=A0A8R1I8Y3_CAEJA
MGGYTVILPKNELKSEFHATLKNKNSKKKSGRRRRDEDDLDSDEDYELEDEENQLQNPLVLIGPTGVGKTALIRTLARQENMRIISTGPESDRTGSEIKKKLQEAMRSHRVDQQSHRRMTFFTTYTTPIILDKEYTQSLIVFEHVDVFFESLDRHGVSALLESVNEASVPVIFTTET